VPSKPQTPSAAAYALIRPRLTRALRQVQADLDRAFANDRDVAAIIGRVKEIKSYARKASELDSRGAPKYPVPLRDVQDQLGCRVIVRSPHGVRRAAAILRRTFGHIQDERRVADPRPAYFGYDARHLMCVLPERYRVRYRLQLEWFEVQVSTLFQFAWTEMEHDLGYKGKPLTPTRQKIIHSAAALSYAADQLFIQAKRRRK
jgi:ppGpp synthetase/RelA/SpoT-type nucleotidyltranferase